MKKRYVNRRETRQLSLVAFVLCLSFFSVPMCGQSSNEIQLEFPKITPVSPAVTEMEKYQSYPVSHCTGIPDITIPLYEIVAGEVTIPVTLSYHSSGLKPKEQSGVAGTGWALNLEPSISRQINGAPDEQYKSGWFYVSDLLPPWQWDERMDYYDRKCSSGIDTRPDKFTYKLPHGGGSGYFRGPHMPMWTVPRTNDRVVYQNADGIDITDENGVQYHFGETREKTGEFVTRWLCSSIYSARHQGQQLVHFSYGPLREHLNPADYCGMSGQLTFVRRNSPARETFLMSGSSYYRVEPSDTYSPTGIREAVLTPVSRDEIGLGISEPARYTPGNVSMAFLSEVHFLGNNLSVSYKTVGSTTARSEVLDEIEVRDNEGRLVRQIKFYITPYNSKTSLTKLDSIRISSPGAEDRLWAFDYNASGNVPSIYTTSVDHWGFCNGREDSGNNGFPNIQEIVSLDLNGLSYMQDFLVNYEGGNRNPSPGYAQTGILRLITDPQGIQTRFTYEGNCGAFRDTSKDKAHRDYLHPVGGLRVSAIESYDPHTRRRIRKHYEYGLTRPNVPFYEPVWGGGAINHIVTQRDYYMHTVAIFENPAIGGYWTEDLTTYTSMPVCNISMHDGSAVMYNVVSEVVLGDDETWTKTLYYYEVNMHDFENLLEWDDNDPAGSVEDFLVDGITEKNESLVRRKPYYSNGPIGDFTLSFGNQLYGALLRTEYYRAHELTAVMENTYSRKSFGAYQLQVEIPERNVVTDWEEASRYIDSETPLFTTHYEFLDINTHRQLDKETTTRYYTSGGKRYASTTEKRYTYDYDFTDPGFSLKPRIMETTRSDSTKTVDTYDYLSGYPSILSYHKHTEGESSRESRILFKDYSCLPQKVQSRTDKSANFRDEVIYRCYDEYGNVTEIAGKDGTPVSFLWSYKNCFPIAQIENATIDEVCTALGIESAGEWASGSSPDAAAWVNIGSLREKLPNARVTTYEYAPLQGVVAIADPNGIITRFDYDNYSRLTDCYYLDENLRKVMLQKYIYHFGK